MADQAPLDLRALADVEEPEVVHEALRRFRRRVWTRYVWVGLAIVFAVIALIVADQPRDLRDEVEAADARTYPNDAVWRVNETTIALDQVVDLGDAYAMRFFVIPDRDASRSVSVTGAIAMMGVDTYEAYAKLPKRGDGTFTMVVGPTRCLPRCPEQEQLTISLRDLGVPASFWRLQP